MAFSFNGGKDSTVLLYLMLHLYHELKSGNNNTSFHTLLWQHEDTFEEVKQFVHECDITYNLQIKSTRKNFKEGIEKRAKKKTSTEKKLNLFGVDRFGRFCERVSY